ncbi:MAG: NfeD family protein [Deltaproteobacteria bacterium]|nr:NfeD family protein [Deltaproteobacteria bacterium]MBW2071175.1 NfeD family protein [Deltaproteobacteria bacterium]
MPKFTLHNRVDIENDVQEDLNFIVDSIKASNLEYSSIYLIGAFGRGEGTVRFDGSRWRAVNDYDLLVIAPNCERIGPFLQTLAGKLAQSLKVDFVDLGCVQRRSLPFLQCTIQNYDFKYGSKLLAGEDVLGEVPQFRREDIGPYEIVRLICNRAAGLLSAHLPENVSSRQYYANQCMKACIATGDAAVYLVKGYHHLYAARLEMFRSLAAGAKLPFSLPQEAIEAVIAAYEWKLKGLHSKMFSIDKALMKIIISEVYCAITRYCTGKHVFTVAQAERELLKYFKNNKKYGNSVTTAPKIGFLHSINNVFGVKNRTLFSQPFFYCQTPLSRTQFVKEVCQRFWMIPAIFRNMNNPNIPVLIWARFHH